MSEKEKMISQKMYNANDETLVKDRIQAKEISEKDKITNWDKNED